MSSPPPAAIDPTRTLLDLVTSCPDTRSVFARHGMDTCCGGGLRLVDAATAHHVDLDLLLAQLAAACAARTP